jgi:thiamine-phosphate pyrophosphorylase
MTVTVITSSDKMKSEIPVIISLFKNGLPVLHLRKPKFSTRKMKEYLDSIPEEFHSRIIIHSHHKLTFKYKLKGIHFTRTHLKKKYQSRIKMVWYRLRKPGLFITRSFHHLESMKNNHIKYSYVFLNPFFSKTENQKLHFDIGKDFLNKQMAEYTIPVYASGNINNENVLLLKNFSLSGAGLSKVILDAENPVSKYLEICKILESKTKG